MYSSSSDSPGFVPSRSVAAGVVGTGNVCVDWISVVMRGNCPFLVGNTAADPLFAALDRSNALSLSLGYFIGCGRPDSSGRHGGVAWRTWRSCRGADGVALGLSDSYFPSNAERGYVK